MWKSFLWFAILVITAGFGHARDAIAPSIGSMGDAYVEAWARFYPSRAIEAGLESGFRFRGLLRGRGGKMDLA
jgi:hypothetical protein